MKYALIPTFLLVFLIGYSQNGDTANDAIYIDGVNIGLNILDFNEATQSGLPASCTIEEDVYFQHQIEPGENTLTIGLESSAITLLATMEYQVLLAPNNDITNIQEITCDSYFVLLALGGSFEMTFPNAIPNDVYYIRMRKKRIRKEVAGIDIDLFPNLINNTTITMVSSYDATLSMPENSQDAFKMMVKNDVIKLSNSDYTSYKIYGIDGKIITTENENHIMSLIDIAYLNKGLYVLILENDFNQQVFKFIKR